MSKGRADRRRTEKEDGLSEKPGRKKWERYTREMYKNELLPSNQATSLYACVHVCVPLHQSEWS